MSKWRLILSTLPFAVGILLIKLSLIIFIDFKGIIDIQEIRVILTGGIFLIGFMLAGTMADYKESEKIPGEIANILEGMEEISIMMARKTSIPIIEIRKQVLHTGRSIRDWFYERISEKEVHLTISEYQEMIHKIDQQGGAPPILGRLLSLVQDLRRIITRSNVIHKTGFLITGYALLEILIVIVSILLLIAKFDTLVSEILIILFVEVIYIYMYKLIRDIDDPFEYEDEELKGAAEVQLFPLLNYLQRLEERSKE